MKFRPWFPWIHERGSLACLTVCASATAARPINSRLYEAPTPPPINWPSPALPDGPIALDTGIQHEVRMVVTKGLVQPWSMAFLPDGAILVTERPGRLRLVRNGVLEAKPVAGLPKCRRRASPV